MRTNKVGYQPNFGMVHAEIRNPGQEGFLKVCEGFSNRFKGRKDVDLLTAKPDKPQSPASFFMSLQCSRRGRNTDSRQEAAVIQTIRAWARKHDLGEVVIKR